MGIISLTKQNHQIPLFEFHPLLHLYYARYSVLQVCSTVKNTFFIWFNIMCGAQQKMLASSMLQKAKELQPSLCLLQCHKTLTLSAQKKTGKM